MSEMEQFADALDLLRGLAAQAKSLLIPPIAANGSRDSRLLDREQRACHGLAWIETLIVALQALLAWARDLDARHRYGTAESLLLKIAFGEYIAQVLGGIPISANEFVRPIHLGLDVRAIAEHPLIARLMVEGGSPEVRAELAAYIRNGGEIVESLDEDSIDMIRQEYRRFSDERVTPHAHRWHLTNALVPETLIAELAQLGTFGICIAPEYGGLGLGKLAMCVITEELSRGWIGVGSIGTRAEIAGELISLGGTPAQKSTWLAGIASGAVLPTAVFTEPSSGSDLASLATRAVRAGDGSWRITGAKTWISQAVRSDLMTLMARTGGPGREGLSMFLAPKPRGRETDLFPIRGMSGSEISVLGYRGLREYAISFDAFEAPADSLLGGAEGLGFRQLMRTFEVARIQTAARAVGVARRASDLAWSYAIERRQFGKRIVEFPRIADKLVMMLVETVAARELTYFAARQKEQDRRCDVEAGMAKLLAARVAWTNADCSLQIHGANGYALESEISRVWCDARVLNIFEGTAEIQAQVIARGLLGGRG